MNLHFTYFLLDILAWVGIAVLICNLPLIKKSYKYKLNNLTKINIIFITFVAGLFSVLIDGLPNTGISINSLTYALVVSFSLGFYLRSKSKKQYLPRISKRDRKETYIGYIGGDDI